MVIGRQIVTEFGTRIDLLGLDRDGDLHIIELKRDRTPRDAVAQLLDYGAWARSLDREEIANHYRNFAERQLEEGYAERFDGQLPEALGVRHHLVLVASELDTSSERIVSYLADEWGLPINVIFFRYFTDGEAQYLARSWLNEPQTAEAPVARGASSRRVRELWNGSDFYVALGVGPSRTWEACERYGFVSAGGGRWYVRTLDRLFVGARIFVCIPGSGYVAAGTVSDVSRPLSEMQLSTDGVNVPLLDAPGMPEGASHDAGDSDNCEYGVKVEWITTLPLSEAIWERGMFANQNTVCELRSRFTLDRLIKALGISE
jgi:hypothetical protein